MRDFQTPGRSAVYATSGMVATSHPLAAAAGLKVLQDGGNAMDAALATAFLLTICEPHMCGLGGDAFALWSLPDSGSVHALNGSGRAPGGLDAAALRAGGHSLMPHRSVQSVTLPGAVDAFCHLHETQCTLPLDRLLAPAIAAAETGVPVAPRVARDWAVDAEVLSGAARRHYLTDGKPPATGTLFRAPGPARVLRAIAAEGRAGFYEGPVARDLVASLQALGGSHSLEELAATRCTPTVPISGPFAGAELVEHPPNGQGATALLLANILSHFDTAGLDPLGPGRTHLEAEATKLAYDTRNRLISDPEVSDATQRMTDPALAKALAGLIDPDRAMADPAPLAEAVHRDTVYLTVVDRDRMAVSLIFSIFKSFGTGLASREYGILFQNRGEGFSLKPDHPNEAGPGKRPLHTIIPAILREGGRVTMPFGVMGGSYQSTGHVRFLSNLRQHGMELQAAIDAPRAFWEAGRLKLETGYPDSTRRALADLGHEVITAADPIGGAQAIVIHDSGVLEGASDPRKDGCAIGY